MKKVVTLWEEGDRAWKVVARDPEKPKTFIDTNEYIYSSGPHALLTDPGGLEIFPAVFSAVAEAMDPRNIGKIFASHQDPDVISSLALWAELNPNIKCHVSWLWSSFIPHFSGGNESLLVSIDDEGGSIEVGNSTLQVVPAHFLHSSGNHHLFDSESGILFTGDVGAALLPVDAPLYVEDFDKHLRFAEGFHRRWMGSPPAKNDWCQRARRLNPTMLCPQHGAIYKGDNVKRFLDWFEGLEVGVLRSSDRRSRVAA